MIPNNPYDPETGVQIDGFAFDEKSGELRILVRLFYLNN